MASGAGPMARAAGSLEGGTAPRTVSGALWTLLNALQALFTLAWTCLWIPAALLVRVLSGGNRLPLAMARRIWAPGLLWGAGVRVEVEGLEELDFTRPHFFVMNHQSQIDIAVLFHVLPVNLRFIVKEELRKVPLLGTYIAAMGMVFIDRTQRLRSLATVRAGAELLRAGQNLVAFPEGGRSRSGRIGRFKSGVLLPAIEAGAHVVPMAIDGAAAALPPDGFRVRPGVIRVAIGQPISTEGLAKEDRRVFAKRVREQVVDQHLRLSNRRRSEVQRPLTGGLERLVHPESGLGED